VQAVADQPTAVDRLFELAALHGYDTDAGLARALGVTRGAICRLRQRKRGIGLEMRLRIARLFPQYERRYLFPDEALELSA
jgi:plasmid maintenance system antidote protein VapI